MEQGIPLPLSLMGEQIDLLMTAVIPRKMKQTGMAPWLAQPCNFVSCQELTAVCQFQIWTLISYRNRYSLYSYCPFILEIAANVLRFVLLLMGLHVKKAATVS